MSVPPPGGRTTATARVARRRTGETSPGRREKVALARRLSAEITMSLPWIAGALDLGS